MLNVLVPLVLIVLSENWYKPGQSSGSVLGEVSSSMEECRAETVALYLVGNTDILKVFGVRTLSLPHSR